MKALWPTVVKVLFLALFVLQGVEGKAKVRDSDDGNTAIQSEVCVCSGSNKGFNSAGIARFKNVSLFPDDYGTSCKAWDKVDCPQAWPGETYGPWCCMRCVYFFYSFAQPGIRIKGVLRLLSRSLAFTSVLYQLPNTNLSPRLCCAHSRRLSGSMMGGRRNYTECHRSR